MVGRDAVFEKGEAAAKVSIACMTFLAVVKGLAAIFSGSVGLLADALNSFSDILASTMVWVGMRLDRSRVEPEEGNYRGTNYARNPATFRLA